MVGLLTLVNGLAAAEAPLLLLHTNDVHDHVRPGYEGIGGLPLIAHYVSDVRAERKDVLLVDAGDMVEKGDLVAHRTHGELTFQLMREIGYDAVTIGNHDHDQGIAWLRRYAAALGRPFVCLNAVDPQGQPWFDAYRIVKVGELRVALIGLIAPQETGTLDFAESGRRLGELARHLKQENHVVLAVCHHSAAACRAWSKLAPDVDIFVSGHSHEFIEQPAIVEGTGALIVQAGCYAMAIGRLDLRVDLETKRMRLVAGGLVHLRHAQLQADEAMVAKVMNIERKLTPEASEPLLVNSRPAGLEIAWVAAEALRRATGADVGFCHPGHIIRDRLPAGPVDVNAVFITGGQRGERVVVAELTGAEIRAYVEALAAGGDPAAWSGFSLAGGTGRALDLGRRYRIVMPQLEWEKRFMRAVARSDGKGPLGTRSFAATPASTSYTDAIVAWLRHMPEGQRDIHALAAAVRAEGGS